MPGSIESLVAVAARDIEALQAEVEALRKRCHELETDRATVGVLQRAVTELREHMPNLARQAAREAVTEMRRRERADWLGNLRAYAAVASVGVALGALIVSLVLR